jgi:hypothetical protein
MFLGGSERIAAAAAMASNGLLQLPALLATSNACVRFGGMNAVLLPANMGLTAYLGAIA